MVIAERLEERMRVCDLSQSELARRVGVSQGTIAHLISGRSNSSTHLHKIARELATSPAYLTGETDDPAEGAVPAPPAEDVAQDLGLVAVKEVDLALGLGGGYIDDVAVLETTRYFPASWLRELTRAPAEHLVFARTKGDSMKPTLSDGDIVIIDLTQKRIREQDGVYAIAVAQLGMVKRIWANPDGSYKIKSDNPSVAPETAHDDEMFVLGQVVGKVGKL